LRRTTLILRGIEPAGISVVVSCTRNTCQSTNVDFAVSKFQLERFSQVPFVQCNGYSPYQINISKISAWRERCANDETCLGGITSVYLNCCCTSFTSAEHKPHVNVPDMSSGRTYGHGRDQVSHSDDTTRHMLRDM
jgi:hypothetical protein